MTVDNPSRVPLFLSFDDFPDPPTEEIFEPKSFRNQLISTLAYVVIIPICTLFFLLQQQVETAVRSYDQTQTAIACGIAFATDAYISDTARLLSEHPRPWPSFLGSQGGFLIFCMPDQRRTNPNEVAYCRVNAGRLCPADPACGIGFQRQMNEAVGQRR